MIHFLQSFVCLCVCSASEQIQRKLLMCSCLFLCAWMHCRKKRSVVALLLQLVLALAILNAFFVVGVDRVESPSPCMAMGVILHYLPLAVLAWLVALTVYIGVATGCGGWENRWCLLTSVVTWGELTYCGWDVVQYRASLR